MLTPSILIYSERCCNVLHLRKHRLPPQALLILIGCILSTLLPITVYITSPLAIILNHSFHCFLLLISCCCDATLIKDMQRIDMSTSMMSGMTTKGVYALTRKLTFDWLSDSPSLPYRTAARHCMVVVDAV
jgi:hypothetical protein